MRLEIIKNSQDVYKIYLNDKKIDYFNHNYKQNIEKSTCKLLNALLNTNYNRPETLQEYLIKNHLIDIESMNNYEFANYLLNNIPKLDLYENTVMYKGFPVLCVDTDFINYTQWHYGLITDKFGFCRFNRRDDIKSKNNRKLFFRVVKQVVDYLEKFEICLIEKDIEDMTNWEFANYLLDNISALNEHQNYVNYKEEPIYCPHTDFINYDQWHYGLITDKFDFCKFNNSSKESTRSKGNRKQFFQIVKQTVDYLEKFEIKLRKDE